MISVGVFPSGSEVSIEISRALNFCKDINLIGLASLPDYGEVVFKNNISNLPFFTDSNFIPSLKKAVKKYKIRFLIPGMDEVAYLLKLNEIEIGCEIIYSSAETAEIIRRKSSTYNALKDYVPTPILFDINKINNSSLLPIFCKPDIGYGSRGVKKIKTLNELNQLKKEDTGINIFTEYLPGEELTVDCFSSNNSKLLFAGPRTRERTRMGISVTTRPVNLTKEIKNIASLISNKLNMVGCWFFQIKKSEVGKYKLTEVASRVSGSMATYRLLGLNFILLDIYQRLGRSIIIPKLRSGDFRLERAFDVKLIGKYDFDSVYVDLDDCLILSNSINTDLIAFLFGCINKRIPIFLITRHQHNLNKTLKELRISLIFDDIYHITDNRTKSEFIKHKKPLFIDDSFSERQEVSNALGCHVASPDIISMEYLR